MKCLVLAAGFSTRLYPLTENFPKGLLTVKGKEILQYTLDDLATVKEIEETAFISNHKFFSVFQNWLLKVPHFQNSQLIDNQVNSKDERLGAIGDFVFALDQLGWDDDILVLPSDTLFSCHLSDVVAFFHSHRGVVNVVRDCKDKEIIRGRLGCAEVKNDELVSFEEKPAEPKSTLLSVPIYIYPRENLPLLRQYYQENKDNQAAVDSPGTILPWLIERTKCFAYVYEGYSYDIGTVESYNQVNSSDSW